MTTRGLEDLDGGLGSCLPSDDILLLEEQCSGQRSDGKARAGASRLAGSSSWTHVLQDPGMVAKEGPGASMAKAGSGPRSGPAHRKSQAAPPLKPPPPPPPPPRDDLPWGELTLNKLLVLASLVALLGSALQLCQDAVTGEVAVAAPQQRAPSSPPPKRPQPPQPPQPPEPKPPLSVPPPRLSEPKPGPLGPQAQRQDKPEAPEAQGEPGGSSAEVSGEERAPFGVPESQERPQEKPKKGEKLKKLKLRREKPRREEKPQALSGRWEARRGHRPWRRDSREPEHEKQQAWSLRGRHDRDRPRQKPRGGKGRD